MRLTQILIFACFIGLLTSCKTSKRIQGDEFLPDKAFRFLKFDKFEDVQSFARENGKCLYIDFYADWCMPCQMMDETIYQDQYIADQFSDFVSVKVNGENYPEVLADYNVRAYPTIVVLDKGGDEILRHEGTINSSSLLDIATNACK